jgi:tetratricopeptide (TPR) repeat protein
MASISTRRHDWLAVDAVRNVKFLAACVIREEAKAARAPVPPPNKGLTPLIVAKLLPPDMREPIHGRKSMRVPLIHLIVKTYVSTYDDHPAVSWQELCRLRRYLMMHALYNGLQTQELDMAPVTMVTAGAPEMLLNLIHRGNDGEFAKFPQYKKYPVCFLVTEILSYFMHCQCSAYPIVTEKFFRDIPGAPQELVRMMTTRPWYESFAAVRLFGFASTHPSACLWLLQHPKALTNLLRFTHLAEVIIERHVQKDKMVNFESSFKALGHPTLKRETYIRTTRVMAAYAGCMATLAFSNTMHHFGGNYDDFRILRQAVYDAELLEHFFPLARQLMRWLTPGRFMSKFLEGIYRCLEMDRTAKVIFPDDLEFFREHKISPGWESLKYFNHPTFHPSNITFLLCHALSVKYLIGAHWAMAIIAHTLENCSDEVCRPIIEVCGRELVDLAHVLTLKERPKLHIQNVLLEALLRHAGFSHKVWRKSVCYIGELKPTKKIPEFCVEAALYCRRANLEDSLPLAEKQHRVKVADSKKDQGNTLFKKGRYRDAIDMYTEALAICPLSACSKQAVYYSNRAECYLRVNEPQRAVHDCNRSLCLDQSMYVKVQWRRSRAYQRLNLDYPAWLDMYCIKEEWKSDKGDTSGVDFKELEGALREKVCIVDKEQNIDLERKAVDYL